MLLSCGVHSITALPCYQFILPFAKHNCSKSIVIRGVWGFISSFSGILLQVIQIKQRSHSQPWQKRVKICFMYLWRLTSCFCRKHHCSASRQAESQITLTSVFIPFSFAIGPLFSSLFVLLGHRATLSKLSKYSTPRSQMQGKGEIHHPCMYVHRCVSDTVDLNLCHCF